MLSKKRVHFILFLMCVVLLMATGCRKKVPVGAYGQNYTETVSDDTVRKAIITAGIGLGWNSRDTGNPNELESTLQVRGKHTAVVIIAYGKGHYRIQYKNSINLAYKEGKIHPQYRVWLMNLEKAIALEISRASL